MYCPPSVCNGNFDTSVSIGKMNNGNLRSVFVCFGGFSRHYFNKNFKQRGKVFRGIDDPAVQRI